MVVMRKAGMVLLLAVGLAALLRPSLREKKALHWTQEALLALHTGLQSHLVEKEHYPMLNQAPAADLAEFLHATGHLTVLPNPRWLAAATYRAEGDFKGFTLVATNAAGRVVMSLSPRPSP